MTIRNLLFAFALVAVNALAQPYPSRPITLVVPYKTLMKQGMVTAPGSPEEIATQIRSDVERWKKFIAQTGITAD